MYVGLLIWGRIDGMCNDYPYCQLERRSFVKLLVLFPPANVVSHCEEFQWMDH